MGVRTLDLFCGAGGSSWGAKAAGASIACGVDAWDLAINAFSLNFPRAEAKTFVLNERTTPDKVGDLGKIDLILASPECTNHSCAKGNKPRSEKSRRTARYVLNFARELEPRWIVLENVVPMRGWDGYDGLVRGLGELGYNVRAQVLDANDFGVAQTRRRLFLLCDRKREPGPILLQAGRKKTARSILDAPTKWESRLLRKKGRAKATLKRAERAIAALGTGVPFLIVYYGSDGSGGWQPLDRPLRTLTTLDRFGLVTWDGRTPMLRMLQVPELKRAMGIEGNFRLDDVSRREQIMLLGNGVCPPVMSAIVNSLLEAA
jgi:DNA (cytosine-5)-methyltransferase 1